MKHKQQNHETPNKIMLFFLFLFLRPWTTLHPNKKWTLLLHVLIQSRIQIQNPAILYFMWNYLLILWPNCVQF